MWLDLSCGNTTKEVLIFTLIAGFDSRSDRLNYAFLKGDLPLQKLFSAFPAGWPGIGLLLLRLLVGVTLIAQTVTQVRASALSASGWFLASLVFAGAVCMLLGLVTPVVSILIGIASVYLAFSSLPNSVQNLDIVVLSTAIALLGPGAFSIDARMFGRREIFIPSVTRTQKS